MAAILSRPQYVNHQIPVFGIGSTFHEAQPACGFENTYCAWLYSMKTNKVINDINHKW